MDFPRGEHRNDGKYNESPGKAVREKRRNKASGYYFLYYCDGRYSALYLHNNVK